MDGVNRPPIRRLAAAAALLALLACSGLGLCWQELAGRTHACCADDSAAMTAPAGPCASAVTKTTLPTLAPPASRVQAVAPALSAPETPASALAPLRHVQAPQLVLRI